MEESEQDKSEEPSSFKLSRARKKGTVARGADLGFLTGLAAFFGYMSIAGADLGKGLADAGRGALVGSFALSEGHFALLTATALLFAPLVRPLVFLAVVIFGLVLLMELVQTGFVFSGEPFKPDFNRLNPGNNLKRLFSLRLFIETLKNILKFACYSTAGYLTIRGILETEIGTVTNAQTLFGLLHKSAFRLVATCLMIAAAFAVLDQIIARRDFLKRMRMSRRELRREHRDREGEPRLKQKRKQLHTEFTKSSKSLRNVRSADVLITNPTHYAIGLKYDARNMTAPKVVCVGAHLLAQRLKRLAFIYGVPIIENRTLARELYVKCTLDAEIPDHCFQPVADIYNTLRRKERNRSTEETHV